MIQLVTNRTADLYAKAAESRLKFHEQISAMNAETIRFCEGTQAIIDRLNAKRAKVEP